MDAGGLVSDDIIIGLVGTACSRPTASPATCSTASRAPSRRPDAMKAAGVPIDFVLEIGVPDGDHRRMSGRRAHLASGRTYHVKFNPPKVEGRTTSPARPDPARRRQGRNRQEAHQNPTLRRWRHRRARLHPEAHRARPCGPQRYPRRAARDPDGHRWPPRRRLCAALATPAAPSVLPLRPRPGRAQWRQYERLFAVLAATTSAFLLYNGGNGSMETCRQIQAAADARGYPLTVVRGDGRR